MSKVRTPALRFIAFGGAAVVAFASQPAFAADTTGTLSVNATVSTNCAVTTTAVAFGEVDVTKNQAVDGTGGISVTCTSGTDWTAKANAGSGSGASIASRKMTSGANLLNYSLYTTDAYSSVWGDGVDLDSATIGGTGNGSAQAKTIYGRIPAGQTDKPQGAYADTVTITVSY